MRSISSVATPAGQATAHRHPASVVPRDVSTLGSGRVESLADLLRAFNHQHGSRSPTRRSTIGSPGRVRDVHARDVGAAHRPVTPPDPRAGRPEGRRAIHRHRDPGRVVVRRQGRPVGHVSRAVHDHEPAASKSTPPTVVRRRREPRPNCARREGGTPVSPRSRDLDDQLLLADRGYPSVATSRRSPRTGLVHRAPHAQLRSVIRTAWVEGQRIPRAAASPPVAVPRAAPRPAPGPRRRLPRRAPRRSLPRGGPAGPRGGDARLCTNLPRTPFSLDLVGRLYRSAGRSNSVSRSGSRTRPASVRHRERAHCRRPDLASLCAAVLKRFLAHARSASEGRRCRRDASPCVRITSSRPRAALLLGVASPTLRRSLAYLLATHTRQPGSRSPHRPLTRRLASRRPLK